MIEVPVYISMKKKVPVEWTIKLHDIRNPALRLIYEGRADDAVKAFSNLCHHNNWERDFQFDLLMGFWLAIHCEEIDVTKRLMEYDIYLR